MDYLPSSASESSCSSRSSRTTYKLPPLLYYEETPHDPELGVRHFQTFLLFLATFLAATMRVNMSLAIVAMTNPHKGVYFDWNSAVQSYILAAFFFGYVLLQIPGAEMSKIFSGRYFITFAIAVNSLACFLLPLGASIGGWQYVSACRMMQGMTQAFVHPSTKHLSSLLIPPKEQEFLTTLIFAGNHLGIATQLLVSGFIASALGWPYIFYVNGFFGAIWVMFYMFLGSGSPEETKCMPKRELRYIQKSFRDAEPKKIYPTPWGKIMTSLPFWAVIVAHCGESWGFFTLITEIPTFVGSTLNISLIFNGLLSSMPYLAMSAFSFPMVALSNHMIRKQWFSVTNTRKLFNTIGSWGPAMGLIGLTYIPVTNLAFTTVVLSISVGINAGHYAGYMLVHVDLAPNFSTSLMTITGFLASILSVIAPVVGGSIVKDGRDTSEWKKVFYITSGVYFFTNLFFLMFGTSVTQEWNEPENVRKKDTT